MVISTIWPTTLPPRARGAFQLTPKSWRLIVVSATKPARVLGPLSTPSSHHGVSQCPRYFTLMSVLRDIPPIVSSPERTYSLGPTTATPAPGDGVGGKRS